jgi:outer membrane immunogenic protein
MHLKRLMFAGLAAFGMTSAATAADLIVEPPPEMMYDATPVGNWDGPYVGVFGGWGGGLADHTNGSAPSPCAGQGIPAGADGCDVVMSGALLGVVGGANFALTSNVIGGIAGDIAWSGISGTDYFGVIIGDSANRVNWEGSIRGVLGFDGGTFMPYVTAGLAVASASHTADLAAPFIPTVSATHVGGTVGAGVQIAVADNIALDLQARVSKYGEQEYDHQTPFPAPVFALMTGRVTAGLNISF